MRGILFTVYLLFMREVRSEKEGMSESDATRKKLTPLHLTYKIFESLLMNLGYQYVITRTHGSKPKNTYQSFDVINTSPLFNFPSLKTSVKTSPISSSLS